MSSSILANSAHLDTAAIDDVALRLAMLRRMASLGMRLAEDICERAIGAPYHPEPRHEPGRAFATVTRAVRLTLVLQERMEAKLNALRKGEAPAAEVLRARTRRPVDAAPDQDADDTAEPRDGSHETLRDYEREQFDELLAGPFDDCVAVIRADLGLQPNEDLPESENDIESALATVLAKTAASSSAHTDPSFAAPPSSARAEAPHPPDSG